ncbi:MAG: phage integrase N-terminal SAM-like domain-containing protein [Desulfitobacteriaceae bacterium]
MVSYTTNARIFIDYSNRPIEQLDEYDIRNFLWYLIKEKKALPSTVNTYSAAIRFLFAVTLNRTLNYLQIPRYSPVLIFSDVAIRFQRIESDRPSLETLLFQ